MFFNRLGSAIAGLVLLALPAQAQIASDQTLRGDKPFGDATAFGDAFGGSLAEWRNWVFVTAPREASERGQTDGAVYIYRRDRSTGELTLAQTLRSEGSAITFGDRFGTGVVAENGRLMVSHYGILGFDGLTDPRAGTGADGTDFVFAGQDYAYRLNRRTDEWEFTQRIISPTPGTNGSFGGRTQSRHMALNNRGDRLVVGEPVNSEDTTGLLHVYHRDRRSGLFNHVQTVEVDSDTPERDVFAGDSIVAMGNRHIAVSVRELELDELGEPGNASGDVYVYRFSRGFLTESPVQILEGDVIAPGDCEITGDVQGMSYGGRRFAMAQSCADGGTGRVDIFKFTGGRTPLRAAGSITGDVPGGLFGSAVFGAQESLAMDSRGRRLVVGSAGILGDATPDDRAELYVRTGRDTWTRADSFAPDNASNAYRYFGSTALFISRDQVAISSMNGVADVLPLTGEVSIYEVPR
jgi:hypothetical protein